jgi:hypothetical protein
MGSLAEYYERDVAAHWVAADFIEQAAHYLQEKFGVPSSVPPPRDGKHRDLAQCWPSPRPSRSNRTVRAPEASAVWKSCTGGLEWALVRFGARSGKPSARR